MSIETVEVIYKDIKIKYEKHNNTWDFTLRGRERSCASLAGAEEMIDRPVKDKTPFERIKCFMHKYRTFEKVTVTSVAEGRGWSGSEQYVWCIDSKKQRSKETTGQLYPRTPHNTSLQEEWTCVESEIVALRNKQDKLVAMMKCLVVKPEVEL